MMHSPNGITKQIGTETLRLHIHSTLKVLDMWSDVAEELLLGTSAQESHCGYYRRQINGPARGIYQMEPATEVDIWVNYLSYHPPLMHSIMENCGVDRPSPSALETNLMYQTAMARIHYLRVKHPLPAAGDLPGQAAYWKKHYNTVEGKGTVEEYIANYRRYIEDV